MLIQKVFRALRKYRGHAFAEQKALVQALVAVVSVRAAIALLGFRRTLRLVRRLAQTQQTPRALGERQEQQIIWAIQAVARRVLPMRPCLSQALAAHVLLGRRGRDSELRIGVTKSGGELAAHAWLEQEGHVIIGGAQSPSRFTPLPPLNREKALNA